MFVNNQAQSLLYRIVDGLLAILLLLIIVPLFVPFSPTMPAPGLDPSWALGLNQAVAQGLAFGKQIIFTLGPYSAIYTKAYHPATDLMMIAGSIYLACSYWFCLILLMQGIQWRWVLALGFFLLGMIYAKDSLFFSYPLLAGLMCCKILCWNKIHSKYTAFFLVLIFSPLGLLPLIKGSLLILCSSITLLCPLFFILNQKKMFAFICIAAPLSSTLICWSAAGQQIINLPDYFFSSIALASGFTDAMANDGNNMEIILYLISSATILFLITRQKQLSKSTKLFLFALFFIFLFLSFKAGFTRHFGHAFIAGTSILMAALLLPYVLKSRLMLPILCLPLFTATYIDGQHTHISLANNIRSTYLSTWHGLQNRIRDKNGLKQNFDITMNYLSAQASFPVLKGAVDVYSYDQTYLIASGMRWSPRPVFQSYSVFTPQFAKKNKHHLLCLDRPDTVLFKIQPIDNRIPALEDGSSWSALMNHYQPEGFVHDFLLLHPKTQIAQQNKPMQLLSRETHYLGERVLIPEKKNQVLFTEIKIQATVLGRLATLLFKTAPLQAIIELQNGTKKYYRINANMAKSTFMLSPLIENTQEFAMLYSDNVLLKNKEVKAITITSVQPTTWQWHHEYSIRLSC